MTTTCKYASKILNCGAMWAMPVWIWSEKCPDPIPFLYLIISIIFNYEVQWLRYVHITCTSNILNCGAHVSNAGLILACNKSWSHFHSFSWIISIIMFNTDSKSAPYCGGQHMCIWHVQSWCSRRKCRFESGLQCVLILFPSSPHNNLLSFYTICPIK